MLYTDSTQAAESLCTEELCFILSKYHRSIELIHASDISPWNSRFKRSLRVVFRIPEAHKMDQIESLMNFSFSFIDTFANLKLSSATLEKSKAMRLEFVKSEKTEERKEELEKKQEEKLKREREAFDKLSPAEKEKEERKRAKRELKKKQASRVKVMYA